MFFKLFFFATTLLLALVGWSWLRTLRDPWVRRHRGTVGWILSAFTILFLFIILKLLLPKI